MVLPTVGPGLLKGVWCRFEDQLKQQEARLLLDVTKLKGKMEAAAQQAQTQIATFKAQIHKLETRVSELEDTKARNLEEIRLTKVNPQPQSPHPSH